MLQHTFTPSDVTEKSGYLDQSIISQCSVLLKIPEKETQNQFSCRGDVTLPRVFTAQVKVKSESNARPKTTRVLFNQPGFLTFSANFTNKIEQKFSSKLENPPVTLHCTPAESKNAEVLSHHKALWPKRSLHPSNPTMYMTRGISTL